MDILVAASEVLRGFYRVFMFEFHTIWREVKSLPLEVPGNFDSTSIDIVGHIKFASDLQQFIQIKITMFDCKSGRGCVRVLFFLDFPEMKSIFFITISN